VFALQVDNALAGPLTAAMRTNLRVFKPMELAMALSGLERMGRFRPEVSPRFSYLLLGRGLYTIAAFEPNKNIFDSGSSSPWSSPWRCRGSSAWGASDPR
jgi:hypothetical protein